MRMIDRIQVNKKDLDRESGRQKGKNKGKEADNEISDFTLGGDQAW